MKYVRQFDSVQEMNQAFSANWIDILGMATNGSENVVGHYIAPEIPNNEIWYRSTDGNVVTPYSTSAFGANIVSNTYTNGKGVITLDGNVTSIGNSAFRGCSGLTGIKIPTSVTNIGSQAFRGCTGLTSVTIPSSVTKISTFAFIYCTGLTSVTIPSSVTSISSNAFEGCTSLTSVTIPSSVTSIGAGAFFDCTDLTSIVVDSNNSVYDSRNNCNAIIKTSTNTLISGCKNSVIPNTVTSIGGSAFESCSALTSVTIPSSVTSIGGSAFNACSSLTSVTIPSSVTSIGISAFNACSSLTSVTIPSSVTSIGISAFEGCTGLTSVTCLPTTPPTVSSNSFTNTTCPIYVPAESVDAYKAASTWSTYADRIQAIPS